MNKICVNNNGLNQIVCMNLIKNFNSDILIKHQCIIINDNFDVQFINNNNNENKCKCSLLKLIFSFPIKNNNEELFYSFLHNNKLKINMGILYLSLYDKILKNDSSSIYNFSVQMINEEVSLSICKNKIILYNLFENLKEKTKNNLNSIINSNNLNVLVNTFQKLLFDIIYIMKPNYYKNLIDEEIILILIDLICELNGKNQIELKEKYYEFQYEGFKKDLIYIEFYLLKIFSLLTQLYFNNNNNNENNHKNIFNYFINKIFENNIIQNFTFHITLIRIFSIFLNRYLFEYSIKNKINFSESIQNFYSNFFEDKNKIYEFNKIIINNIIKLITFISGINNGYFNYFGEHLKYLNDYYYYFDIFYLCDYSLFKILMSNDITNDLISFKEIINFGKIKESEKIFENINEENSNNNNIIKNYIFSFIKKIININESKDEIIKAININTNLLSFLLKIIKNPSINMNLLFETYNKFKKNKLEDDLLKEIIKNEKNLFIENIIYKIINHFLKKQNYLNYSEILDELKKYEIENFKNEIFEIIEKNSNKTKNKKGLVKYSLKNEFINNKLDFDLIISPINESDIQKFLIENKFKNFNDFNYYQIDSFIILKNFDKKCYYNFFKQNLTIIINLLIQILKKQTNY